MKTLFFIITVGLFACCPGKYIEYTATEKGKVYLIKRIKRIGNWYAVYAKNGDIIYKIVTKVQPTNQNDCKIRRGKYYQLEIRKMLEGVTPQVYNYLDAPCHGFDSVTTICIEPKKGVHDLYVTSSLKGLCYIKK